MLPGFGRWCRRYAAHFTAVGAAVYTTAKLNTARFTSVCRRRYGANFTAVDAAFYPTTRVNAAQF